MLDLYNDGRGYNHVGFTARPNRETFTEDLTIELDVEALGHDIVMQDGVEILTVQVSQKVHSHEEILALCESTVDPRD